MNLSNYTCDKQMSFLDLLSPDSWSGKTCQEPLAVTEAKTSESSSKKPRGSQIKTPLFLNLQTDRNGLLPDASWEMGGLLLGDYMMHSFGESPREERESRLSQILEDTPHQRFYLSARACQGILTRANRRGKQLPETLRKALEAQAIPSKLGGGVERDSGGKRAGKGALIQTELSGTLGVSQGQTLFTIEGNGARPSHKGDGYKESQISYTPNGTEQHAVCAPKHCSF